MNKLNLRARNTGCVLTVRAHPGARENAITGVHDGALKVSLKVPPTDGRANEALLKLLAETVGVPRTHLQLLSGATSRTKYVLFEGVTAAELQSRLAAWLEAPATPGCTSLKARSVP